VGKIISDAQRRSRDFPHQVAILIPVGGLVARLMAMHKFCDMKWTPNLGPVD
jgi:hypothetical protein